MTPPPPPLLILGVRRSGTTLLRVMLDRHSQLALPDESYFLPQLTARHRARPDLEPFLEDLRRLPTIREWEVEPEAVRARLGPDPTLGEAVSAIYQEYAAARGKPRWGDKTPMYMQYLGMLERLFPQARYVHLIRDGRDATLSFLSMPKGVVTETWVHPRTVEDFACQWKTEVEGARALGSRVGDRYLEVRYEQLAGEPETVLRRICEFAELPFEDSMLDYAAGVDVSDKPHQQSLKRPPTSGLRDWREDMSSAEVASFEAVAGELLARLGYETGRTAPSTRGRLRLIRYRAVAAAWRVSARAVQASPLWRRRHPRLA